MKKILILANNDVGLYKFRKELIQELIYKGYKVYISLPYGDLVDKLIELGCEFIDTNIDRRGINPVTDLKLLLDYKKIIKKVNPDLVITYTIKPNIYGGIICRLNDVPYIVNVTGLGSIFQREGLLKNTIIQLYRFALKKVKYVFFENKGNKKVFIDSKIIDSERGITLNGAGVNLEEYTFRPMPNHNKISFLFIGRIMKEKGINELFSVAKRIKDEYRNVEFDIVGPFEDDYEDIVMDLQEKGIINYYGYQQDVKSFIENSDCFVLPSYHEGMANVLLEAASMGRPLITTNVHGCKEAINENGYLCDSQDEESLYRCIIKFIKLIPEEKLRLSHNSRLIVEDLFDKKKVIKKTISYIENK